MILKTVLLLCVIGYVTDNVNGSEEFSSVLNCNFNGKSFCNWYLDPRDRIKTWESRNFQGQIGEAACMKSVRMKKQSKYSGRLWSQWLTSETDIGKCLRFSYYIGNEFGNIMNITLSLLKHSEGSCKSIVNKETGDPRLVCDSRNLWRSDIPNEDEIIKNNWRKVSISMTESNSSDFKLILEGTIPSGNPNAKICVDNITSSAEPCEIPKPPQPVAAPSFTSWVELFGMTFAGALALGLTIPIAVFVVCLFERKRRRGMKNKRIIRHADELDLPEGMNTASCEDTYPLPQKYANSQVGVGHPRLMNRAMSTPAGTNGQGGNYTMGKRNGTPQPPMGPRSNSGQMSHTMGRGGLEGGWMMSSQHGDLMENDEYTIDSDYTTHRQMSVPASGYLPASNQIDSGLMQGQVSSMQQIGNQSVMYQNRQVAQPQANVIVSTAASNNPFGTPANVGMSGAGQDNRSLAGSHAANFSTDENRATPGLPFYPPRYEEAMGFNHGQHVPMEEKPPLLPPRVPESSVSGPGTSCSTPLPPAPPPLPLSGHPSAGRFNIGAPNAQPGNEI